MRTQSYPEYLTLENVFPLPYLGSATAETLDAMARIVWSAIGAIHLGQSPSILVA